MERILVQKLLSKVLLFSVMGWFFFYLIPNAGYVVYTTLVTTALLWLIYEVWDEKERLSPAVFLGFFLMVFDWAVENSGAVLGFWNTYQSQLFIWNVPIEIMLLCLAGGTAWAMHLPKRMNKSFVYLDSLIFAFFGALGEYLLIQNNLMSYSNGWTSAHAFLGYYVTWLILLGSGTLSQGRLE